MSPSPASLLPTVHLRWPSQELKQQGYALMCVAYPTSDVVLETVPEDEIYELQFGKYFAQQVSVIPTSLEVHPSTHTLVMCGQDMFWHSQACSWRRCLLSVNHGVCWHARGLQLQMHSHAARACVHVA